ncbi:MAG: hypothetical protein IKV79_02645 [Oscillospiraceae bacterium]|nr:hypothetical protein [Oscillospiraceae bacterium]
MYLYTVIEAIVAIVAFIVLAVCTKKAEGVVYGRLDKAGRITNILLTIVYVCISPLYLFFGMISSTHHHGLLGILGWIVAIINASAALFCGVGLGLSVMFRKKGKSKLSFMIQFLGVLGIGLCIGMYCLFAGNLLSSLN